MKLIIKTGSLFFFVCMLTACTKVITLNLNNSSPKYVVEGTITDSIGTAKVLISQTKDFYASNAFVGVTGAVVTITSDGGVVTTLAATDSGVYTAPLLTGQQNHTYVLNVLVAGQTFTATSTMPAKVSFDSLFITLNPTFGSTKKVANIQYQDPPGKGNSYRAIEYVNSFQQQTIFVNNDDFTDGNKVIAPLNIFGGDNDSLSNKKINTGDTVKIDFQCIDKNVYEYWFSLDQSSTGSSQSAAPGNPVTNMQGGALGYFSANTLQSRSVVAQ
jgi:hypothetical protein